MILRIDRLAIELSMPAHPSPNSASAVQELPGLLVEVAARLFGKDGLRG